jgi:serralysin
VFTGTKGLLRWFQEDKPGSANDKTIVEGDVNGDTRADFQIELKGLITLSTTDFVL